MRPDDPDVKPADETVWEKEPEVSEATKKYGRAAIKAVMKIGRYYKKYPRVSHHDADPVEHGYEGSDWLSGLGAYPFHEAWMMAIFMPTWDHMRFWDIMSDEQYLQIMRSFILPAARYQYRSNSGGYNNMAMETRSRVMYWALLLGKKDWMDNQYDSKFGFKAQLEKGFSEEGWSLEGHYHSAAVRPMTFWAEMYVKGGYPKDEIYDDRLERLFEAYLLKAPFWHCAGPGRAARTAAERFDEPVYGRISEREVWASQPSANMASLGFTVLRRNLDGKLYAAGMNWGIHEKPGAPDRMGVFIDAPFIQVDRATYNKQSVDQATIVVDGQNQDPKRGRNSLCPASQRSADRTDVACQSGGG
jgi:hypothetical protein